MKKKCELSRRVRWWASSSLVVGLVACGALVACGGAKRPTHLPPPVYERPELPPWEPEAPADRLDEAALEGEWADEPPPTEGPDAPPADGEAGPDAAPTGGQPPTDPAPAPDADQPGAPRESPAPAPPRGAPAPSRLPNGLQ
jgi:hypothetical protein